MTPKGSGTREIVKPLEPDRPFIVDLMADAYPDMDDELPISVGAGTDTWIRTLDTN